MNTAPDTIIKTMSPVGCTALVRLHNGTGTATHGPVALALRHRDLIDRAGVITPLGCSVARELESRGVR